MPLDVLGRTRATLKESACFTLPVRKDRVTAEPPSWLGLGTAMIPMNQESLVGAGQQPASITSLPFVHTARRYR